MLRMGGKQVGFGLNLFHLVSILFSSQLLDRGRKGVNTAHALPGAGISID